MTGFKEGASSDDPFSSEPLNIEREEGEMDDDTDEPSTAPIATETNSDFGEPEDDPNERISSSSLESNIGNGLPWIYDRDSITDGRAKTVQLHLQESTLDEQRTTKSTVEANLGESVKKADLREAALLVGFRHLDEIGDQLREWGYDYD